MGPNGSIISFRMYKNRLRNWVITDTTAIRYQLYVMRATYQQTEYDVLTTVEKIVMVISCIVESLVQYIPASFLGILSDFIRSIGSTLTHWRIKACLFPTTEAKLGRWPAFWTSLHRASSIVTPMAYTSDSQVACKESPISGAVYWDLISMKLNGKKLYHRLRTGTINENSDKTPLVYTQL